jgi:hypothetical protein
MRRALVAFVILSLLGGQMSMLSALLGRYHAQHEMAQKITDAPEPDALKEASRTEGAIEHLTIPESERRSPNSSFAWIEDGEFRYQGKLYDVVHEEWRGKVWHVWGIHDQEEEHYLDALTQTLNTPMVEGSTVPVHQRPLALRLSALLPTALSLLPSPRIHEQSFPRTSTLAHQGPYLEVPHPPPWG